MKNMSVNGVRQLKRSYSLEANKNSCINSANNNPRQTNVTIISRNNNNNSPNSISTTHQPFIPIIHPPHHGEVFREEMTRELKVRRPPTPIKKPGKPGKTH